MQAATAIQESTARGAYSVRPGGRGYVIADSSGAVIESTARGIAYGAAAAMVADLNAGRAACVRGAVVWEGERA